jgi:hypothetical protein
MGVGTGGAVDLNRIFGSGAYISILGFSHSSGQLVFARAGSIYVTRVTACDGAGLLFTEIIGVARSPLAVIRRTGAGQTARPRSVLCAIVSNPNNGRGGLAGNRPHTGARGRADAGPTRESPDGGPPYSSAVVNVDAKQAGPRAPGRYRLRVRQRSAPSWRGSHRTLLTILAYFAQLFCVCHAVLPQHLFIRSSILLGPGARRRHRNIARIAPQRPRRCLLAGRSRKRSTGYQAIAATRFSAARRRGSPRGAWCGISCNCALRCGGRHMQAVRRARRGRRFAP